MSKVYFHKKGILPLLLFTLYLLILRTIASEGTNDTASSNPSIFECSAGDSCSLIDAKDEDKNADDSNTHDNYSLTLAGTSNTDDDDDDDDDIDRLIDHHYHHHGEDDDGTDYYEIQQADGTYAYYSTTTDDNGEGGTTTRIQQGVIHQPEGDSPFVVEWDEIIESNAYDGAEPLWFLPPPPLFLPPPILPGWGWGGGVGVGVNVNVFV